MNEREMQEVYQRSTAPQAGRPDCLDSETLLRLSERELDAAAARAAVDHLAGCSDCAGEYTLLDPLRRWSEGVTAPFESPGVVREMRPPPQPAWFGAVAAAAILAVAGLSAVSFVQWRRAGDLQSKLATAIQTESVLRSERDEATRRASDLGRSVDELSRPQVNVPIIDLDTVGPLRGGAPSKAKLVEVPAGATRFDLVLYVSDPTNYERYDIEIRDGHDTLIWRGEELRRSSFDTFTVGLPARMFPAGHYRLHLDGRTGKESRTVQHYDIQIRYR